MKKELIAILGGCNVIITVTTPMILSFIWLQLTPTPNWSAYLFLLVGFGASFFRAIKTWIKKDE